MIVCPACKTFPIHVFKNKGTSSWYCRCTRLSHSVFHFDHPSQWVFRSGPPDSSTSESEVTLLLRDDVLRTAGLDQAGWSDVLPEDARELSVEWAIEASLISDVLGV